MNKITFDPPPPEAVIIFFVSSLRGKLMEAAMEHEEMKQENPPDEDLRGPKRTKR